MKSFKILRERISTRGGGVEIDLSPHGYEGEKMTAYQNYLGGGILGRVCNDCTIEDWQDDPTLSEIADKLRKYFHSQTNPEGGWETFDYETNQQLPISGY
jgi:hypothetical protein